MTAGEWDYAVCGPGLKLEAELTLLLSGDRAREVREHPWLAFLKPGELILMRDPLSLDPPFPPGFGAR